MCMWVETIYYIINNVLLWNKFDISNGNICGNGHILCEFIWNGDQLEPFFCYTIYPLVWMIPPGTRFTSMLKDSNQKLICLQSM